MLEEDKLYQIRQKEGTHLSEKVNSDGSRAALQFDENNNLQGPIDLIEVDPAEIKRPVKVVKYKEERDLKDIIIEEVVSRFLGPVIDKSVDAIFNWMSTEVIPKAKSKSKELGKRIRENYKSKKSTKNDKEVIVKTESDKDKVTHTPDEIDKIISAMNSALKIIVLGIQELSNTIVADDGSDPQKVLEIQNKIKELTSEDAITTIRFMLTEQNRIMLDLQTIQLLEAFLNNEIIIENKTIRINKYLTESEN